MIYVVNKRRKIESIRKQYPDADILDVTSSSTLKYAQLLSPFFPHGGIPIPGDSRGMTSMSVEGIWQGLKVFENEGICLDSFNNATMKNLKRTVRTHGKPLGHQYGVYSDELLDYLTARIKIYLPSYKYVLDNVDSTKEIVARTKERYLVNDILFLDYDTNCDFLNTKAPLSHAGLLKMFIEGCYPDSADSTIKQPTIKNNEQLQLEFNFDI